MEKQDQELIQKYLSAWRRRWTSCRDSGLVTHRESPDGVAIFPSSVKAPFRMTNGVRAVIYLQNGAFNSRQASPNTPTSTSIPAFRSLWIPRPDTKGFGSFIPTTTFRIPAFKTASVQGGVFPK